MTRMITGWSIKGITTSFEETYGLLSIRNKNILIDKLLELRTFIKFKLSKITNYFDLFNVNYSNNFYLRMFVVYLTKFNDMKLSNKILEDLGIEDRDYNLLSSYVPDDDKTSTSKVIKMLSKNKEVIKKLNISQFTKRSIDKM